MRRSFGLLIAVLLALTLPVLAPTRAMAAECADPDHPIDRSFDFQEGVLVGTSVAKSFALEVYTEKACAVTGATATIAVPRRHDPTITLTKQPEQGRFDHWIGSYTVDPADLLNSDAGRWTVSYRAKGTDDVHRLQAVVQRRSQLTLDAGPEPIRDHTIVYRGRLERASWYSHRYIPYGHHTVRIYRTTPHHDTVLVAIPRSADDGRYWLSERYRGAGEYAAVYIGDRTTGYGSSRQDYVGPLH